MALSIITFSKMTISNTTLVFLLGLGNKPRIWQCDLIIHESIVYKCYVYGINSGQAAVCHYAEYCYDEYHLAECFYDKRCYAECLYAMCGYAVSSFRVSLCRESLYWVSLCWASYVNITLNIVILLVVIRVSFCWVSVCWAQFCWVSLSKVSLYWVSWDRFAEQKLNLSCSLRCDRVRLEFVHTLLCCLSPT